MGTRHSTTTPEPAQEPKRFLIRTYAETRAQIGHCPNAQTWLTREKRGAPTLIHSLRCNQWACPWCGQRRAFCLAIRCETATPTKLITLTVQPKFFQTPRQSYDATRRKVGDLAKIVRKHRGTFEYLKVLEATKKGWPHYHLVARCGYIQQGWLSREWAQLTGAPIVDIRSIKKAEGAFKYVLKYLCKQTAIPWTHRRVSWSRQFFPKNQAPEKPTVTMHVSHVEHCHPSTYITDKCHGQEILELRPGVWQIDDLE